MSKRNKRTKWRTISWSEYIIWLQGRIIAPDGEEDWGGEVNITFSDGAQARITSCIEHRCCQTCGCSINSKAPTLEVREQRE